MSPVFRHGRLRLYLLKLLDEAPRHGYEVIRLLQDRFMGVYAPSPGTIYPRLARLEEEGLVTHDEVEGRKVYRITDKGRQEIQARLDDLAELEEEITESVRDIAREVTEDVRDTVRNLREELTWASREVRDGKERTAETAREQARLAREQVRDSARQARDELHASRAARRGWSGLRRGRAWAAARTGQAPGPEPAGRSRTGSRGPSPAPAGRPPDWPAGCQDWPPGLARLGRMGQPGQLARLGRTGRPGWDAGKAAGRQAGSRHGPGPGADGARLRRELRAAAWHTEVVGSDAVSGLRIILEETLARIRDEIFGGAAGGPDAGTAKPGEPGRPADDDSRP